MGKKVLFLAKPRVIVTWIVFKYGLSNGVGLCIEEGEGESTAELD